MPNARSIIEPDREKSWLFRMPWSFRKISSEKAFYDWRRKSWAEGFDQILPIPWTLLWIGIIARHWHVLSFTVILRSFSHFIVVIGPLYWPFILGKKRYLRYRDYIIICSIMSYSAHPGGGLYRDAILYNEAERTGLDAAALLVRLIIGSRTLFWVLLIFGYELPPIIGIPLNTIGLTAIMRIKSSIQFCQSIQTVETRQLFQMIANSLPLLSIIPLNRPHIPIGTDICNPLVQWMLVSIGFLLPSTVHLCTDYSARRDFARLYPSKLCTEDRIKWLNDQRRILSPGSIGFLAFLHANTALWYYMIGKELQRDP